MPTSTLTRTEVLQKGILKKVRKREAKTLAQIAKELGTTRWALAGPITPLVRSRQVVKHPTTPATYTKA